MKQSFTSDLRHDNFVHISPDSRCGGRRSKSRFARGRRAARRGTILGSHRCRIYQVLGPPGVHSRCRCSRPSPPTSTSTLRLRGCCTRSYMAEMDKMEVVFVVMWTLVNLFSAYTRPALTFTYEPYFIGMARRQNL